jgi:hypothetical protein
LRFWKKIERGFRNLRLKITAEEVLGDVNPRKSISDNASKTIVVTPYYKFGRPRTPFGDGFEGAVKGGGLVVRDVQRDGIIGAIC